MFIFIVTRVITIDPVSVLLVDYKFIAAGGGGVPSGEPGLGNGGEKEVALPTDGIRHRAEDGLVRTQRIRLKG